MMIDKFIEENIEKELNNFLPYSSLRKRYLLFCKHYGVEPVAKKKLSHELGKRNIGIRGTKGINYSQINGRYNIGLMECKY